MGTFIPEDDDTMTLSFDDGAEIECAVIAVFRVGERNYIALLPLDTPSGNLLSLGFLLL